MEVDLEGARSSNGNEYDQNTFYTYVTFSKIT